MLLLAYASVYVAWGATYFAIRIAVESWPPLALATMRFAIAGAILYAALRLRGAPAPGWRAWGAAAIVGGLMLGGGNGTVCWAEQWVPSGETALILAGGPLWTVVLPWAARRAPAPRPVILAGVLVGLAGVAVLIGGAAGHDAAEVSGRAVMLARLSLIGASFSWVVGSLIAHRLPLPASPALATAMEMIAAAPILGVAAAVHGDWGRFHPTAITPNAWLALGYLVVFGSLAGFGAYTYLLVHAGPTRSSTGAFVNPVIAVALGAALGGEALGPRTFAATAMIVVAVAGVVLGSIERDGPGGGRASPGGTGSGAGRAGGALPPARAGA